MLNELDFESRIKESIDFIQGCDLADCDHTSHTMPELAKFDVDEMNPEALVASNAIVSIVAGMTKTNKQVVKDSCYFPPLSLIRLIRKVASVGTRSLQKCWGSADGCLSPRA